MNKNYWDEHREEKREYNKECSQREVDCEVCGCRVRKCNWARHVGTRKHMLGGGGWKSWWWCGGRGRMRRRVGQGSSLLMAFQQAIAISSFSVFGLRKLRMHSSHVPKQTTSEMVKSLNDVWGVPCCPCRFPNCIDAYTHWESATLSLKWLTMQLWSFRLCLISNTLPLLCPFENH